MVRVYTFVGLVIVACSAVSQLDRVYEWMNERKERKLAQLEKDTATAKLRKELMAERQKKDMTDS
ncbi:hypothetical protein KP509_05G087900 [Ceratopteris richardii]|uniref:Uncharacterized protein n=1 Tax=Ceratopteris richardii TaxID=49495 RepID=A0A8T2UT23_CERRI|nr:hypothetical protein KP509_05G087900 [Ceratopteris richardii]